ncbi:MAG TPA: FAD-binding protein [Ilumatobacter sp.]|nr:FAD-binding protein [Ilumatobacter sp.]
MDLDPSIDEFAAEVGPDGPVTIAGLATRGGPVDGVRTVMAPVGVADVQPAEMTVRCGAGTPVDELDAALAIHGQAVAIPPSGTVGGALAVGRSGIRRLGYGPVRDTVLQVRYVNAAGEVVKAGGPTVKNVSGFDLCRLMVGAHGTLGFLVEVILRTRPRAPFEQWYVTDRPPADVQRALYRPTSLLWDGTYVWTLLEGNADDVAAQAQTCGLEPADDPPELPTGGRWSLPPGELGGLAGTGRFVAELGVGIVHHEHPPPERPVDPAVAELHRRIKHEFDPTGRLNPGIQIL